jgi:hypothetical protein
MIDARKIITGQRSHNRTVIRKLILLVVMGFSISTGGCDPGTM